MIDVDFSFGKTFRVGNPFFYARCRFLCRFAEEVGDSALIIYGQTDQIFELRRMKPLNKELNELTSAANYESMTNQSAMRKLYSALTDLTWNTMWDIDTRGKTRDEYRNEIRVVQAEFNELMVDLQAGDGDPEEVNTRLIELDDLLYDMEHAWRRMKRK